MILDNASFRVASEYFFKLYISKIYVLQLSGGTQTNTARPNRSGDARPPSVAGLGGLGLPNMDQMLSAMPDVSQMNQLLQNPAISQMMQSLLSNPQYMNQVLLLNSSDIYTYTFISLFFSYVQI